MPVFDSTNYAQNLLQAARALEQINHQVQSLQNEAAMLQNMARNLERIDFPQLQADHRPRSADRPADGPGPGIGFKVEAARPASCRHVSGLGFDQLLTGDQRVAQARARLDAAMAALQAQHERSGARSSRTSSRIRSLLDDLAAAARARKARSRRSRPTNQLLALSAKQQLQLQDLLRRRIPERRDRARASAPVRGGSARGDDAASSGPARPIRARANRPARAPAPTGPAPAAELPSPLRGPRGTPVRTTETL